MFNRVPAKHHLKLKILDISFIHLFRQESTKRSGSYKKYFV